MSEQGPKITIKNNGPIRIEGADIQLFDSNGNRFDLGGRTAVSICRCGASQKQPFCDGAHNGCQFKSEVVACALPPK